MQLILVFNVIVLTGLTLFLLREELRYRRLSKRIAETKEDLVSIVHQLRSPLANLRKYNEFLQGKEFGTLSFAQQEAIDKVQSSLGESLVLLDRLLARSRLDEEKVTSQPSSLNVRDLVKGAVDAVRPIADQKNHSITIDGNGKVHIFTDPLLLHGILDELLSNAVHYTPDDGEIKITITDRGTFILIEIRDTGIGISEEECPHIFEKFYRGERAKPMFAGNGLGLSFAKEFTNKLGGDVRFKSKVGKGTTFSVTLLKKVR